MYEAIRDNKDMLLTVEGLRAEPSGIDPVETLLGAALPSAPDTRGRIIELIRVLFPRTTRTKYGTDWDVNWSKEKRIASRHYFDRYFTLSISGADVSDKKVDALIANIGRLSLENASAQFMQLLTAKNARVVIAKLRFAEDSISVSQGATLSQVVAHISDVLPTGGDMFSSPFQQAAIMVTQLVRRVSDISRRQSLGEQILTDAPSLLFACEVMRWSVSNESGEDGVFSSEGEITLKRQLARRIQIYVTTADLPIYESEPASALTYLQFWQWFGGSDEVRKYIQNALEENPDSIFQFIAITSPSAWNMATGLPTKTPFRREQYNLVAKLADVATVASILRKQIGSALDKPEYYAKQPRSDQENLAHQFMSVHYAALAEQANKISETPQSTASEIE